LPPTGRLRSNIAQHTFTYFGMSLALESGDAGALSTGLSCVAGGWLGGCSVTGASITLLT